MGAAAAIDHHRHGRRQHSHAAHGPHRHPLRGLLRTSEASGIHRSAHHGHTHGLVDRSILRSHGGLRAVGLSFAVLGATAAIQAAIFLATGSVALLADLIHNAGDALTAIPLAVALWLRSARLERWAGFAVVLAILASACVALYESLNRLLHPHELTGLLAVAAAGAAGFAGNEIAARVRLRAGRRLDIPALVADGLHARADGFVSLAVIAGAAGVALGLPVADPLIGLVISLAILRITWSSWQTVRHAGHHADGHPPPG